MAEFKRSIANKFRQARRDAGLSLREAAIDLGGDADRPGVTGPYKHVENGRKSVSDQMAITAAELFGTTAEKLIGIRGYKDPVEEEAADDANEAG